MKRRCVTGLEREQDFSLAFFLIQAIWTALYLSWLLGASLV
jgi:hypothetical protein